MKMLSKAISGFATETAPVTRVITLASLFGFISAALFVITEIAAIGATSVWALSGAFHLSPKLAIGLSIMVAIPCLYVSAVVVKLAYDAETSPENN